MSFSNLEYLYNHLPARFRRDDKDLFLKRFLQVFGETLDDYDSIYENFFEQINPQTAELRFVVFWLRWLFDWSWFPKWFTETDKRRLYEHFATHLARRGTAQGIVEFLEDFWIESKVHKSPVFYENCVYGEPLIFVDKPLVVIIEIGKVAPPSYVADCAIYGESFCGESFYAHAEPLYTQTEVENLLRYQRPHGQEFIIYNRYLGGNSE